MHPAMMEDSSCLMKDKISSLVIGVFSEKDGSPGRGGVRISE